MIIEGNTQNNTVPPVQPAQQQSPQQTQAQQPPQQPQPIQSQQPLSQQSQQPQFTNVPPTPPPSTYNPNMSGASQNDQVEVKPAGAWSRFWAFVIDGIVFGPFALFVILLLAAISGSPFSFKGNVLGNIESHPISSTTGLLLLPLYLSYFVYLTYKKGATIGKSVYGLRVVRYKTNENISLGQTIIREIFKVLYLIPLLGGLLYFIVGIIIIFSKEKRSIPDILAKTQVLKEKKAWSMGKQLIYFLFMILLLIMIFSLGWLADKYINPDKPRPEVSISSQPTGFAENKVDGWSINYDSEKFRYPIMPVSKETTEEEIKKGLLSDEYMIQFERKIGAKFCIDEFDVEKNNNPNSLPLSKWRPTSKFLSEGQEEPAVINGIEGLKVTNITEITSIGGSEGMTSYKVKKVGYLVPREDKVFILQYKRPIDSSEFSKDECDISEEALVKTFETFKFL